MTGVKKMMGKVSKVKRFRLFHLKVMREFSKVVSLRETLLFYRDTPINSEWVKDKRNT